eukprot:COSAG04_NODE_7026_length_1206_cov_2.036134_1_plen_58_part_10
MLVQPVVAGLADAYGRVFYSNAGRVGWVVFWLILGQKQIDQLESGGGGASMYETPGAG